MWWLNARTSRTVPLVLLIIPALLITLFAVLSWLDPPAFIAGEAHFAVLAVLALSTWLPVHYSRQRQTYNSAVRSDEDVRLARERILLHTLITVATVVAELEEAICSSQASKLPVLAERLTREVKGTIEYLRTKVA